MLSASQVKAGGSAVPSGSGFSPASVCPVVLEAGQPVSLSENFCKQVCGFSVVVVGVHLSRP